MLRSPLVLVFSLVSLSVTTFAAPASPVASSRPPNFLILLAAGMGFSDAGCYGGELETPHLDRLAAEGVRFTQAYNASRDWATHSALLTGFYAQHIRGDLFPAGPKSSGPGGQRPAWAPLLPSLLKRAGYVTFHAGQWRLDGTPQEGGFDRSFPPVDAARRAGSKTASADRPAPETAIADHVIEFLQNHGQQAPKAPFLAYVAFDPPDVPFKGASGQDSGGKSRFQEESDLLRKERLKRLWDNGMLSNAELAQPASQACAWEKLSTEERRAFSRRMEFHAARIEQMDQEIGRILEQLRVMNTLDNTVVLFLSDNGSGPEGLAAEGSRGSAPRAGSAPGGSCLEAQLASVLNTPLRHSNMFVHEGGISTPFIVRWPAGMKAKDEVREQPVHVVDVAPTILKLAGQPWPKKAGDLAVPPADGTDLSLVLRENKSLANRALWWTHEDSRAFRLGDWKWVAPKGHPAELFYLRADRSETRDLAAANPERLLEMESQWNRLTKRFREDSEKQAAPGRPLANP